MAIWICTVCGWEYNEDEGLADEDIAPGTKFEDGRTLDFTIMGSGREPYSMIIQFIRNRILPFF